MMIKWLVIGTDQRLEMANDLLEEQGYESRYLAQDTFDENLKDILAEWQPKRIILPLLAMKQPIPAQLIRKDTVLYIGQSAQEWRADLDQSGVKYLNYLQNEQFIWQNAQLTAEAFVQVFYEQTKRQIAGKNFYIAGFGRVGKAVAHVLHSMQASVTITARADAQLAEANTLGYTSLRLTPSTHFTDGYLVNTIPSQWLDVANCSCQHIFDVSSAPGCLKPGRTSEYYTIHLKLPGIHFPADAAAVLADAILRMDTEERGATCLKGKESD
ncbi:dipicolinate synthase subunit A [Sporosarcina sp.]|uniref:dipicolinate synthase subunit A n=1 Tax=Sporosarcina sp. TaxID=49982 RepID=UPI0026241048|nr:dipicolinate synthase subunit A [Sporosarcina sp.]